MNSNAITKYTVYVMYTGEAAGIAMGLVMVGTRSSSAIGDLLTVSTHTITIYIYCAHFNFCFTVVLCFIYIVCSRNPT